MYVTNHLKLKVVKSLNTFVSMRILQYLLSSYHKNSISLKTEKTQYSNFVCCDTV